MRLKRLFVVVSLVLTASVFAQQSDSKRVSPRDKTELQLGNGWKVMVDYSRPKIVDPKTGQPRKIFGGLVPYGEVWRTGANEATSFVTEGDLLVGDARVPKGSYTLYTIPGEDSWTLIISKKIGQSGIPYPGPKDDLARVKMTIRHLAETIDPFTIQLVPPGPNTLLTMGVGGRQPPQLCLSWEHTISCVVLVPAPQPKS